MPSAPNQTVHERNQRFVALYQSGRTLSQVARECDVSHGTVFQALKRMGIARRSVGRPGKTSAEDQTKQRWYSIKSNYGLTRQQWDAMLIEQLGLCDICGEQMRYGKGPVVDHDHMTGKVRSLLCQRCNVGLGFAESFAAAAKAYLEKHRE